jgi:hypothetical protein
VARLREERQQITLAEADRLRIVVPQLKERELRREPLEPRERELLSWTNRFVEGSIGGGTYIEEVGRLGFLTGRGILRVLTNPIAEIFVDGRRVGRAPKEIRDLSAGEHRVRLVLGDGREETRIVVVREGQIAKLTYEWK